MIRTLLVLLSLTIGLTASAAGPVQGSSDPYEEVVARKQKVANAFEGANQVNPASEEFGKGSPNHPGLGALEQFEQVRKWMNSPGVATVLKLLSNPDFSKGIKGVVDHPNRGDLLLYEGLGIALVIVIRIWRKAKAKNWRQSLWVGFYTTVLMAIVVFGVVPWYVLGESYANLFRGAWQVFSA